MDVSSDTTAATADTDQAGADQGDRDLGRSFHSPFGRVQYKPLIEYLHSMLFSFDALAFL